MDKQLEQRIRDRAYELWMQNGCQPGRADEYWFQAEQEILGTDAQTASDVGGGTTSDAGSAPPMGNDEQEAGEDNPLPMEVSSAPLGMTSETSDEVTSGTSDEVMPSADDTLTAPATPKTRRRRSAAATTSGEGGDAAGEAPKRRRTTRTP